MNDVYAVAADVDDDADVVDAFVVLVYCVWVVVEAVYRYCSNLVLVIVIHPTNNAAFVGHNK